MSILINQDTRLLIQGITGKEGIFHTQQMLDDGTNIVAGISPGKGGDWVLNGRVPVFDSVNAAVQMTGANASVIFVPAKHALDAIYEATDAGIALIIVITEGIPMKDIVKANAYVKQKGSRLIGPNSPGIFSPGQSKAGIIPAGIAIPGNIGVVSRSGTLTYEILHTLKQKNAGISTCVGIGGDAISGTSFTEILSMFEADAHTDQIIMLGEIGGMEEELAANFISTGMSKPVFSFIAGLTAPAEKRMGHAGAIIEGNIGTAQQKVEALKSAGVRVVEHPEEIATMIIP